MYCIVRDIATRQACKLSGADGPYQNTSYYNSRVAEGRSYWMEKVPRQHMREGKITWIQYGSEYRKVFQTSSQHGDR